VPFHTAPVKVGVFHTTYGRDPDGNIFELQEIMGRGVPQALTNLAMPA
jgi:hypothetical protein